MNITKNVYQHERPGTIYDGGLFSVWEHSNGEEFPTYTIITTSSNENIADIHDQTLVFLDQKNYEV